MILTTIIEVIKQKNDNDSTINNGQCAIREWERKKITATLNIQLSH